MAGARYTSLKVESRILVDSMIPTIASNFALPSTVDAIPAHIRMRAWDCDRKEHIRTASEDDVRNWGLQFLKDLLTISTIKKGKVDEFHADLGKKVEWRVKKEEEVGFPGGPHPWVKLQDIKEMKAFYENPEKNGPLIPDPEGEGGDGGYESVSEESYYELVEEEDGGKKKRGRPTAKMVARKAGEKNLEARAYKGKVKKGKL
jgi:hypothetical protein